MYDLNNLGHFLWYYLENSNNCYTFALRIDVIIINSKIT